MSILGVGMLWLMTAEAVLFLVSSPADLGCEANTSKDECTMMSSPYDPGLDNLGREHNRPPPACAWDPRAQPACTFLEPNEDDAYSPFRLLTVLIVMAFVNPFVLGMEWIILNVLIAPSRDSEEDTEVDASAPPLSGVPRSVSVKYSAALALMARLRDPGSSARRRCKERANGDTALQRERRRHRHKKKQLKVTERRAEYQHHHKSSRPAPNVASRQIGGADVGSAKEQRHRELQRQNRAQTAEDSSAADASRTTSDAAVGSAKEQRHREHPHHREHQHRHRAQTADDSSAADAAQATSDDGGDSRSRRHHHRHRANTADRLSEGTRHLSIDSSAAVAAKTVSRAALDIIGERSTETINVSGVCTHTQGSSSGADSGTNPMHAEMENLTVPPPRRAEAGTCGECGDVVSEGGGNADLSDAAADAERPSWMASTAAAMTSAFSKPTVPSAGPKGMSGRELIRASGTTEVPPEILELEVCGCVEQRAYTPVLRRVGVRGTGHTPPCAHWQCRLPSCGVRHDEFACASPVLLLIEALIIDSPTSPS